LEFAPTDIVTDKFAADKTVRNGLGCMRCHDQGMKTFTDNMRQALEALPGGTPFDLRTALDLYPGQAALDKVLKEDGDRFLTAMRETLGKEPTTEPLIPVTKRYLDDPLPLSAVSGELGLPDTAGMQPLFRTPRLTRLGLMPLASQGLIRRDTWEDIVDQTVTDLGLGTPVPPVDGVLRRSYPAGPAPLAVSLKTNKPNNSFEPGDELIIYVANKTHKPVWIELVGTSPSGGKVILTPEKIAVRSGETFRYPNQGGIKIKPGQGKEQITLLASDEELPPAELLRGKDIADRVMHPFFAVKRYKDRLVVSPIPARMLKTTLEIETR
jgi:serine/threonine-protein kinase